MKKLPAGMDYQTIRGELEHAYAILRKSGHMTDDMEAALRYVGRLVVDAELEAFHSQISRKP